MKSTDEKKVAFMQLAIDNFDGARTALLEAARNLKKAGVPDDVVAEMQVLSSAMHVVEAYMKKVHRLWVSRL